VHHSAALRTNSLLIGASLDYRGISVGGGLLIRAANGLVGALRGAFSPSNHDGPADGRLVVKTVRDVRPSLFGPLMPRFAADPHRRRSHLTRKTNHLRCGLPGARRLVASAW